MKKYLLAALILISQSAVADFATNCTNNGGTMITANSYGNDKGGQCNDPNDSNLTNNCNGKRFCRSGKQMNWWSAFTWCEAIGGQQASFASMCPGTQTVDGASCSNLKGVITHAWTSTGKWTNRVYSLWSNAGVGDNTRNSTDHWAVCEAK